MSVFFFCRFARRRLACVVGLGNARSAVMTNGVGEGAGAWLNLDGISERPLEPVGYSREATKDEAAREVSLITPSKLSDTVAMIALD